VSLSPTPWAAYASLAASMALVGSYVGLSKLLVAVFPVLLLAWLRFGIAAVAMVPWTARRAGEPPLSAQDRRLLFLQSLFGNFLFSICMLYGVALTSALAAGVVMAALPATVALLARAFLGERIRPRVWGAIGCAALGIALLALARHGEAAGAGAVTLADGSTAAAADAAAALLPLGYALLLGAVLCEAAYVVIGKRLAAQVPPRRVSALINLWGLALVTPLGLWQARDFDFGTVDASIWLLLVFYALAASAATVWLWMRGLRHVPAPQAGVFTVFLPLAAAAVGVGWLGEPFGAAHGVAFGLAVAGVLLATWPARRSAG
jgi:drug/metabolite transporter (DMT)-like permease